MRYLIGIDLGTTNTCVAYVDTNKEKNPSLGIQLFKIPQLTDEGVTEALPTLPSCCFINENGSFNVGTWALKLSGKYPLQGVHSAKSWLCHTAAARRDHILPFEAPSGFPKISPVEATTRYLKHIRDAWNQQVAKVDPESEFEQQEIILTVPASFDEVARMLTVEAAKLAGLFKLTLLEEPQAAFYSWIGSHEPSWQQLLKVGEFILVCDVGGGTTDFSLIEVKEKPSGIYFERQAVGDHLLLGGDNMDAAIVHLLQSKLQSQGAENLDSNQWLQLRYEARQAKELLLGDNSPEHVFVTLQGKGSKVIGGSTSVELKRNELYDFLMTGFFGEYNWQEAIQLRKKGGIRSVGLPYEDEPSITKHLAHFIVQNQKQCPKWILFNGGVFKSTLFQEALCNSLKKWFPDVALGALSTVSLDLAVARGAAYYGKVRRGLGVRIGGGSPRSYYLEIAIQAPEAVQTKALCLLPRGSEDGYVYASDQTFLLSPNTPISFTLYSSHVRIHDIAGEIYPIESEEMHPLPPIYTVLKFGKSQDKIPVHIQIELTAIGTLELRLKAQNTSHIWSLEFQLRSAEGQENTTLLLDKARQEETFDNQYLEPAKKIIADVFGDKSQPPEKVMQRLEAYFEKPRQEWVSGLLRKLWDELFTFVRSRRSSLQCEERWWNLIGYFLRPGNGYPLDDFRIKELWKVILADFALKKTPEVQIQTWICYRRIAGGLNKGQQIRLADEILPFFYNKKKGHVDVKSKSEIYPYSEKVRALASFELLEVSLKIHLAKIFLNRIIQGEGLPVDFWALGRLGARHLVNGTVANVVPAKEVNEWMTQLLHANLPMNKELAFLFILLCRETDQREQNIQPVLRQNVVNKLLLLPDSEHYIHLMSSHPVYSEIDKEFIIGDRLPIGLTLEIS